MTWESWENLEDIDFENIGNIPEDFKHEQRLVRPRGLIKAPSLFLKFYEMYIEGQSFDEREIKATKEILLADIIRGEIKPYIGIGFAILSKGFLNIARWDSDCPTVLRNDLYTYQQTIIDCKHDNIQDSGAFCAWELGVVDFEARAWKRYLKSEREEIDKKIYLNAIMEGRII